MKLTVKKTTAIIFTELINAVSKLASIFAIVYIAGWFVAAVAANQGVRVEAWLPGVLATVALVVYAAKHIIDAYLHAQGTQLELSDTNITCTISGFSTRSFSIPLSQISSIHVQQGFVDRFFNISQVVVVQIASTSVVYGFDYHEAVAFSNAFSRKQERKK